MTYISDYFTAITFRFELWLIFYLCCSLAMAACYWQKLKSNISKWEKLDFRVCWTESELICVSLSFLLCRAVCRQDGTFDNRLLEGLGLLFLVILVIYSKVSILKVKQSFPCKMLKENGIKPLPFCNWPHPIKYQVLSGSSHTLFSVATIKFSD